mmetsp:Transcript_108813/g.318354  ORF Transcript_108813/g.318354 Transcript_108813/m.318354 type:complete len:301 (-) Transcript_108813:1027-1929(-)
MQPAQTLLAPAMKQSANGASCGLAVSRRPIEGLQGHGAPHALLDELRDEQGRPCGSELAAASLHCRRRAVESSLRCRARRPRNDVRRRSPSGAWGRRGGPMPWHAAAMQTNGVAPPPRRRGVMGPLGPRGHLRLPEPAEIRPGLRFRALPLARARVHGLCSELLQLLHLQLRSPQEPRLLPPRRVVVEHLHALHRRAAGRRPVASALYLLLPLHLALLLQVSPSDARVLVESVQVILDCRWRDHNRRVHRRLHQASDLIHGLLLLQLFQPPVPLAAVFVQARASLLSSPGSGNTVDVHRL